MDTFHTELAQDPRINSIRLGLNIETRKIVLGRIGKNNMNPFLNLVQMKPLAALIKSIVLENANSPSSER